MCSVLMLCQSAWLLLWNGSSGCECAERSCAAGCMHCKALLEALPQVLLHATGAVACHRCCRGSAAADAHQSTRHVPQGMPHILLL